MQRLAFRLRAGIYGKTREEFIPLHAPRWWRVCGLQVDLQIYLLKKKGRTSTMRRPTRSLRLWQSISTANDMEGFYEVLYLMTMTYCTRMRPSTHQFSHYYILIVVKCTTTESYQRCN